MKTHHKYMDFKTKLATAWAKNNSLLCIGLDPDITKLPAGTNQFTFNKVIIDATADLACAFKPNPAFYEALGAEGIGYLEETCHYIKQKYPDIPIILDSKRGDIGNTNQAYAKATFEVLKADAVTLHPYFGKESLTPFLEIADKGMIIMCKSSNAGGSELQDLKVGDQKLYEYIAQQVVNNWNDNNNCLLMVGATYPEELAAVREIAGDMAILVPGVGAQQGDIEAMLKAGLTADGTGLIINSSREISFASSGPDFAEAARQKATEARDRINQYRGGAT
jgi:orotidine-5'-phosphate decarboxylase